MSTQHKGTSWLLGPSLSSKPSVPTPCLAACSGLLNYFPGKGQCGGAHTPQTASPRTSCARGNQQATAC